MGLKLVEIDTSGKFYREYRGRDIVRHTVHGKDQRVALEIARRYIKQYRPEHGCVITDDPDATRPDEV